MEYSTDPRIKILFIVMLVLFVGGIIAGVAVYQQNNRVNSGSVPKLVVDETRYDFGKVSMADGPVSHSFIITNEGNGDLKISHIQSSCMCTTAVLKNGEETSPKFGMHNNPMFWSTKLAPGNSATLEVTFDPLAHGPEATGPVTRTVTMYTNDGGKENIEKIFTITADVVK